MKYEKAYWLVHNTKLTNKQIAQYGDLNELEVNAIRTGESKMCRSGYNLVELGELTMDEIEKAERDPSIALKKPKSKK